MAVIRNYEAAARHQSFTLAASELNLTQSAVSRQVKEMQHIAGAQLFRRTGREVIATRAGTRLASGISSELDNFSSVMMRAVSAGNINSTLCLAMLPTFATLWLITRLSGFFKKHPDIEISFSTRLEPFNLAEENFDLVIHFGQKKNWPNTQMRKFFPNA